MRCGRSVELRAPALPASFSIAGPAPSCGATRRSRPWAASPRCGRPSRTGQRAEHAVEIGGASRSPRARSATRQDEHRPALSAGRAGRARRTCTRERSGTVFVADASLPVAVPAGPRSPQAAGLARGRWRWAPQAHGRRRLARPWVRRRRSRSRSARTRSSLQRPRACDRAPRTSLRSCARRASDVLSLAISASRHRCRRGCARARASPCRHAIGRRVIARERRVARAVVLVAGEAVAKRVVRLAVLGRAQLAPLQIAHLVRLDLHARAGFAMLDDALGRVSGAAVLDAELVPVRLGARLSLGIVAQPASAERTPRAREAERSAHLHEPPPGVERPHRLAAPCSS